MIKMFDFMSDSCKNCYKCIRYCPVKAIRYESGKAEIDPDKCIACGQCFVVCPKHVRNVDNDYADVLEKLKQGNRVTALLDSSYLAMFDEPERFVAGLKKLGFNCVQEIASSTSVVTEQQMEYMENHRCLKYIITASCPSAYLYVCKYYPELVKYLIPVVSPAVALAKLVRIKAPDSYNVYIGPCLSRRFESQHSNETCLDATISFSEAARMMKVNFIDYNELPPMLPDVVSGSERKNYAMPGKTCDRLIAKAKSLNYSTVSIEGSDQITELLDAIKDGILDRTMADLAMCSGSCLNGPFMHGSNTNMFLSLQKLKKHVEYREKTMGGEANGEVINWSGVDFRHIFHPMEIKKKQYTEKQIIDVLAAMGKNSRADELNCGACGYNSCRDKAVAVLSGMAQIDMCMPYMKRKAETMTSAIFLAARNFIMIADLNYKVVRINPAAERVSKVSVKEAVGMPVSEFIPQTYFEQVLKTKIDIVGEKLHIPKFDYTGLMNIMYMGDDREFMVTMQDVTNEEKRRTELEKLKLNTVEVTQRVIDKQMMVAQEIASLLGETTAETKVALNNLKKVVIKEGE
ncbi:MAG: [Fe-Fe] hydrogenase large subunit C-terminal domain-containing protein [Candidatus Metalachnospira sp.]|nr:[Fe-Fe] hydrogenase large subunit C-terminal domain-containing protein [Candidatus Metalachnospira sp.]